MNTGAGDLEADADSLTCVQSGLSSADQLNSDGRRLVCFFLLQIGILIVI